MVEKFYKISNESLAKEVDFYINENKKRNTLIKEFFEKHGIEGNVYYITANGLCNKAYKEELKNNIKLCIGLNNAEKFSEHLKKNSICPDTVELKKSSKILKDFQNECVKRNIIINLLRVNVGEYFKELGYGGYSTSGLHQKDGYYYLKISTTKFESITPNSKGFEEIKGSEYYTISESLDKTSNQN